MHGVLGRVLATFTPGAPTRLNPASAATPAPLPLAPARPLPTGKGAPAAPETLFPWNARLWGPGFELPGGANEVRRLAALLPLSRERRLLLCGRGMTGAATTISEERRCPISVLVTPNQMSQTSLANLLPGQAERVTLGRWNPTAPTFPRRHHHALLLEPCHLGAAPGALLGATAVGLYEGAELVMVDLVLGSSQPVREMRDRWLWLEGRHAPRPEAEVTAAFAKAGFRVNVTEDLAERHGSAVRRAWARVAGEVTAAKARASRPDLVRMLDEVEKWMLRLRLIDDGALRFLRGHASLR